MSVRDPPIQNRYLDLKEKEMMYMKHMHALTHMHPLINIKPPEICGRVKVIDKKSAQFRKAYMRNVKIRDQLIRSVNQLRGSNSTKRKRSQSVDWNVVASHRTPKVDMYQDLDLFQNDYTHIKAPKRKEELSEFSYSDPSDCDISTDSLKETYYKPKKTPQSGRKLASYERNQQNTSRRHSSGSSRRSITSSHHSDALSHHSEAISHYSATSNRISSASNASSSRAPRNHSSKPKQQQTTESILEIATTTIQQTIAVQPPDKSDHSSYKRHTSSRSSQVRPPSESSAKSGRSKKSIASHISHSSTREKTASPPEEAVFATNPNENLESDPAEKDSDLEQLNSPHESDSQIDKNKSTTLNSTNEFDNFEDY